MTGGNGDHGRRTSARDSAPVITDARSASSTELRSREVRYAITMAFRTACFVAMIFVTGPLRWVLLACAVFLPGIAVVVANQANQRGSAVRNAPPAPSVDAPQLTTGAEIIEGEPDRTGESPWAAEPEWPAAPPWVDGFGFRSDTSATDTSAPADRTERSGGRVRPGDERVA